jgi:hypothetical protein
VGLAAALATWDGWRAFCLSSEVERALRVRVVEAFGWVLGEVGCR